MRSNTLRFLALVGVVVGALGIAACGDDKPGSQSTAMPGQQQVQEIERQTAVAALAEPRGLGAVSSPTRLLRNLYPALWNADGYCWEEGTSDHDGANRQVSTDLVDGDEPPPDLLALFERRGDDYGDYEYKSFNSSRLLLLRQEVIVTASGRKGPRASAISIIRLESPDGRQFWTADESAAVYPCDY